MAYVLDNTKVEATATPILPSVMQNWTNPGNDTGHWGDMTNNNRDLATQFVISISLGLVAFFSFCVC
jgi:hypothetical protein